MSSYSSGDVEESWELVLPLPNSAPTYDEGGLGIETDGLVDPNYFPHPERISLPSAVEDNDDEEMEEGRNSPGWIDPASPRDAVDAALDEATASEEEGFLLEEVELGDLNSGPVEPYCSFSEWWRTPVDMWKTKVGRVGTLWSIAMAAAVMGFVILGRRWYRVRGHNKKLGIQVNADDKKITQLMFQAVRLNEAFFAVRRIPVVKAQTLFGGFQDT
ncbi:hypothetical protein KI387_002121, partial [Taxus chinensis]